MLNKTLTVIFGAGASHDCIVKHNRKPLPTKNFVAKLPLTDDLFDIEGYQPILSAYRGAEAVGHIYKRNRSVNKKETLEEYLKTLFKNSPDKNLHMNIRQVSFYLRNVIGNICTDVREQFGQTAYMDVVDYMASSDYSKIVLITLNWDLLLDWALYDRAGFRYKSLDSYVNHDDRWHYIKLHGSVNWIKRVRMGDLSGKKTDEPLDLITSVDPNGPIVKGAEFQFDNNFHYSDGAYFRYPIMMLPHAEEKKHICPPNHLEAILSILEECEEFWVIGNSMKDVDITSLLKGVCKKASRIKIVDAPISPNEKNAHKYRIQQCFLKADFQRQYISFKQFAEKIDVNAPFEPTSPFDE